MEKKNESAPVLKISPEALRLMDAEPDISAAVSRAARLLGSLGCSARTPKKAAASRLNGQLYGGRPRKSMA